MRKGNPGPNFDLVVMNAAARHGTRGLASHSPVVLPLVAVGCGARLTAVIGPLPRPKGKALVYPSKCQEADACVCSVDVEVLLASD